MTADFPPFGEQVTRAVERLLEAADALSSKLRDVTIVLPLGILIGPVEACPDATDQAQFRFPIALGKQGCTHLDYFRIGDRKLTSATRRCVRLALSDRPAIEMQAFDDELAFAHAADELQHPVMGNAFGEQVTRAVERLLEAADALSSKLRAGGS